MLVDEISGLEGAKTLWTCEGNGESAEMHDA
jgi:hypothetical protein